MAAAATSFPTALLLLLLLLHNFPSPSLSAATPTARRLLTPNDQYFPDAAVAAGPPVPILDTDGKTVKAGGSYYILPANATTTTRAGGITTTSLSATATCPLSVIQDRHADSNGAPLAFLPVATKLGYIVRTSTDLNIEFTAGDAATCEEGGVWKVEEYDDDVEQWFLGTGGVEGKPGARTVEDWFKIVKYGLVGGGGGGTSTTTTTYYKLVHCPGVCKSCKIKCKDVGVFVDENGVRRLALTEDRPFLVKFMKADA